MKNKQHLSAAARVLKKKTLQMLLIDNRVTTHGLKILERWAQKEIAVLRDLERDADKFMDVLLEQQKREHPTSAEDIEYQLKNGLTEYEILEMGGPDLSCRYAIQRMEI